jgi:two-component system chemotaxis response regulator CheB
MIRALVVDDSPAQRILIRAILERDADVHVVGEAANVEEAVLLSNRLHPDITTIDLSLPGPGCEETIQRIMSEAPCPIIVVASRVSIHSEQTEFRILALGALAVLEKPTGLPEDDSTAQRFINQVKLMADVRVVGRHCFGAKRQRVSDPLGCSTQKEMDPVKSHTSTRACSRVVVIGVSTGGPQALQKLLKGLPPDFPAPIAIVQHISRGFAAGLAAWLSETTPFSCRLAKHGDRLRPGQVFLAPDNSHLVFLSPKQLGLDPAPSPDGCAPSPNGAQPSIDRLFQSAAHSHGQNAAGVLLTGMGRDGAQGLLAMRQAGAYTIAQDEASSVVFSMPKTAIELHAAFEVLPIDLIGARLTQWVTQ